MTTRGMLSRMQISGNIDGGNGGGQAVQGPCVYDMDCDQVLDAPFSSSAFPPCSFYSYPFLGFLLQSFALSLPSAVGREIKCLNLPPNVEGGDGRIFCPEGEPRRHNMISKLMDFQRGDTN